MPAPTQIKTKGEIVKAKVVKDKQPGYLYYVDKEGNVCRIKSTLIKKKKVN